MEEERLKSPVASTVRELLVSPSSVVVSGDCCASHRLILFLLFVSSGSRRVELFNCSKEHFELLVGCLVDRTVIPLTSNRGQLTDAFVKLAWLLEWCRMSRVPRLQLVAGDDMEVELNVRALIDTPKQCACCAREEQFVTCAQCGVASWCSERCVRRHYEDHQTVCRGERGKEENGFVFSIRKAAGQAIRAYFGL
jgi:hypothetical protein